MINIKEASNNISTISQNFVLSGEPIINQEVLDLNVFPNPGIDFIEITVASKTGGKTYKNTTPDGSTVQFGSLESKKKKNISKLKPGMFILDVYDGQKTLISKLIK